MTASQMNSPILPVNHSACRVNAIAKSINAQNYLEIGVGYGTTLFSVDVKNKIGVDPSFAFDKSTIDMPNLRLVEEKSDMFFSKLPLSIEFDIIFIDGLHTFEQTYRDLCNSLVHLNKGGVILIDDTRPCDIYSTSQDYEKCCKARQEQGNLNGAWNGDAFKVVYALHDFHPALNYRTIVGEEQPQTLVWLSNLGWREPLFNSLEKISRLSYFDLLDHENILRYSSWENAIDLCLTERCI